MAAVCFPTFTIKLNMSSILRYEFRIIIDFLYFLEHAILGEPEPWSFPDLHVLNSITNIEKMKTLTEIQKKYIHGNVGQHWDFQYFICFVDLSRDRGLPRTDFLSS